MNREIIKLLPAFQDYLWGGVRLREEYGKQCDLERIAESWELSTHPAGQSTVWGGSFHGLTLSRYLEENPGALGSHGSGFRNFPVLIKFIDAKQALSVQVHPSDEYALRVEGESGKTEMWYVMDCEEGAGLYFGVNRPVSREEFRARLEDNTVTEVLNRVDVKKGDCFFIEAGTIHAIGAGILICEIQQNSNTTYRVYDYGRRGPDGKLRELHVDKALDVAKLTPSDTSQKTGARRKIPGGAATLLASCRYFTTEKVECFGSLSLRAEESSFTSLIFLSGEGTVTGPENKVAFRAGESVFLPAGAGQVAVAGPCTFLKTTV